MVDCQVRLCSQNLVTIFAQENGDLISEDMAKMEEVMHIYWRNFIHNGNPNDNTGFNQTNELTWEPYSNKHGAMRFGWNVFTPEAEKKLALFEENFQDENCAFWNELDVYANH